MNNDIKHISPQAFFDKTTEQDEYFLLDVREFFEHEDFNIGGLCLPLGELIAQSGKIPADKPVLVYCKKGVRSQIAIQRLQEKFSLTNLYNLSGGMDAWKMIQKK